MTVESWRRLSDLFQQAVERDPADRERFLDAACGSDTEMRRELTSLLANHDLATGFLERPALIDHQELLTDLDRPMAGRDIAHYRVLSELGHGGMGVVYLAEDTRLGRKVVLKALPPIYALDPRRRDRLRVEARAAAALSHQNVATLYALEEHDDELYLVAEYVPGETLRVELARGALAPKSVFQTALQVARALAAAHAQGIAHRDLKPDNIIRAADGQAKILDFGLARFEQPPDSTTPRLTQTGTLLGTPAYMAPEQLEGLDADYRCDIFAFGIVLYELATGRHPFEGATQALMTARILSAEPMPIARGDLPNLAELNRIVCKCLRKEREQRYQSTADLVTDIAQWHPGAEPPLATGTLSSSSSETPTSTAGSARWWWRFHQIAAAVTYGALLYPLWIARGWIGGRPGFLLFLASVGIVALNIMLRLHLVFTDRINPGGLPAQRARVTPVIRASDLAFVVLLLAASAASARDHEGVAGGLAAAAIGIAIAALLVEPATAKAAFGDQ